MNAKEPVCGFQVYLYTEYSNDQSCVSYWFCIGKSCDCQVYFAFANAKYT